MYRVIKSNTYVRASQTLDVSWLNNFKQIPFSDADILSDEEKKQIINRVLQQVKLTREDWVNIDNYGGVYIKNFKMSPAQYGQTGVNRGAFGETYSYDISCDVIIPGAEADTAVPVQYTYSKTYRHNW